MNNERSISCGSGYSKNRLICWYRRINRFLFSRFSPLFPACKILLSSFFIFLCVDWNISNDSSSMGNNVFPVCDSSIAGYFFPQYQLRLLILKGWWATSCSWSVTFRFIPTCTKAVSYRMHYATSIWSYGIQHPAMVQINHMKTSISLLYGKSWRFILFTVYINIAKPITTFLPPIWPG